MVQQLFTNDEFMQYWFQKSALLQQRYEEGHERGHEKGIQETLANFLRVRFHPDEDLYKIWLHQIQFIRSEDLLTNMSSEMFQLETIDDVPKVFNQFLVMQMNHDRLHSAN